MTLALMMLGSLFALGGIVCMSIAAKESLRLYRFERGSEPVSATILAFAPSVRKQRTLTPILSWCDPQGVEHSAEAPGFSFLFLVRQQPVHVGAQLNALWNAVTPEDIRPAGRLLRWLPTIGMATLGVSQCTAALTLLLNLDSH